MQFKKNTYLFIGKEFVVVLTWCDFNSSFINSTD
jgi:hypothetical protein